MSLDVLELEVRRLPGVVGLGVVRDVETTELHVLVGDSTDRAALDRLHADVVRLGTGHIDEAIRVCIRPLDGSPDDIVVFADPADPTHVPPPAELRRPRIEFVRPGDNAVAVHLTRGSQRAVGHASGSGLAAVAEATLDGLRRLGSYVPFRVKAAVRLAVDDDRSVVVVLAGTTGVNIDDRRGLAHDDVPEEAAAKATLDALNRFLAEDAPGN